MHRLCFLCLIAALTLFAACDDPSSAGLDLIGEEGGVPTSRSLAASAVAQDTLSEVTGGFASTTSPSVSRALLGRAEDPLFGTVAADTFIDFIRPGSLPEGFSDGTVTGLTLELPVDYVYGDPDGISRIELYEITRSWIPTDATPDSSYVNFDDPSVSPFGTVDVSRNDSTISVELPGSYVEAIGDTLTSSTFGSSYRGIALRAVGNGDGYAGPGVVRGFDATRIRLVAAIADTTVRFRASEVASRISWSDLPATPADRIVARDGAEEAIDLDFVFDADGIAGQPLNNAEFRVALDTLLLATPAGAGDFERPRPEAIELLLEVESEGNPIQSLGALVFDEDLGVYRFASGLLTSLLQDELLGADFIKGYRFRAVNNPASVDVLPVFAPTLPDQTPRFEFVVSGGN
ncbi:MAG: DUF4270 family protein [Bacteroidota bacterium]